MTTPPPTAQSTSRAFFERLYRAQPDPWRFADDDYERERYRTILTQIPSGRYTTALEPGCSIGVLTRELADRCRRVIAFDIAEPAVAEARRRCADRPGVEVTRRALPFDLPDETVDLVVLSEVGYYLDRRTLEQLTRRISARLRPGGRLVAAHWTGSSRDHVLHGHEVHDILAGHLDLPHRGRSEHGQLDRGPDADRRAFVLDVWEAPT